MLKFSLKTAVLLCSILVIALAGCKKKEGCTDVEAVNFDADADESADVCVYPNLAFHFHPTVGDETLVYGNTHTINGLDVQFDEIRFYMTELELTINDKAQAVDEAFIITETSGEQEAGKVIAGQLTKFAFNVGVPVDMNAADPALLPADNPLSADSPFVQHWNWTSGYIFLKLEGAVDVNGDGVFDADTESLSVHCGFDDNLQRIELATDQTIDKENFEMHLEFDVARFFANYDLSNNLFSRPMNNPEAATAVMNNVQNAFDFE